jgi:hypothetical protein
MRIHFAASIFFALFVATAFASTPRTYADAESIWEQSKNNLAYATYLGEFTQFSNHFHLDEKDRCYALSAGTVNVLIVITHSDNNQFALVEEVFTDVDNLKARCFKKSYAGIRTKIPPFFPFVLKMTMSGDDSA